MVPKLCIGEHNWALDVIYIIRGVQCWEKSL